MSPGRHSCVWCLAFGVERVIRQIQSNHCLWGNRILGGAVRPVATIKKATLSLNEGTVVGVEHQVALAASFFDFGKS